MKYRELFIQTQREAPSNARTEGFAFLVRAGYITREGKILPLGQRVIDRARKIHDDLIQTFGASPESMRGFFSRLQLDIIPSHETDAFYILQPGWDEELITCPACGYASSRARARSRKQPFDEEEVKPIQKVSTPECNTIETLAAYLNIPEEKTAKALMYTRVEDGKFIFVVVRGDMQVSAAKLQKRVGEVRPATADEITRAGAVAGYASPIGLGNALIVVDDLIPRSANLTAGANEHGYHFNNVNTPRDYQAALIADVIQPGDNDPCPECGAPLEVRSASLLADNGSVNFDRLLAPLAEKFHDEKGLALPASIAPFDAYLMNVPGKTLDTKSAADQLYAQLSEADVAVLYDDRDERAGVKFNDADLIGCPVRITVGEKNLQQEKVELKFRQNGEVYVVAMMEAIPLIQNRRSALFAPNSGSA
jgi:prolyl-tRNA synthetase